MSHGVAGEHFIQNVHERSDGLSPEPLEFVADVVCACGVISQSGVRSSPWAARNDALAKHGQH